MKKKQTALLAAGLLVLGGAITVAAQTLPDEPKAQEVIYSTAVKDKGKLEQQGITIDFVSVEKDKSGGENQGQNDSQTAVKSAVCPAAEVPAK